MAVDKVPHAHLSLMLFILPSSHCRRPPYRGQRLPGNTQSASKTKRPVASVSKSASTGTMTCVRWTTNRHGNVAPGHRVPFRRIHHAISPQAVAAESNMPNVADPERNEVAAHDLDLGGGEQHGQADEAHEQIHVPQLPGQDDGVLGDELWDLLRDLLRDEPRGIADGAEKARDAVPLN